MSQENVDLVRTMQQAFEAGRFDDALALFHPDVVYDARERPDGKIWHGREGVRRAILEWATVWQDWQVHSERFLEAGDDTVLILWREQGRGKGSSAYTEQRGGNLVTIADRLIVRLHLYVDQRVALRAVGLEE